VLDLDSDSDEPADAPSRSPSPAPGDATRYQVSSALLSVLKRSTIQPADVVLPVDDSQALVLFRPQEWRGRLAGDATSPQPIVEDDIMEEDPMEIEP